MSTTEVVARPEGDDEDYWTLKDALSSMGSTLKPLLEEEQRRLQNELTFLKEVHAGISGGAPLEASSTFLADAALSELLGEYFEE